MHAHTWTCFHWGRRKKNHEGAWVPELFFHNVSSLGTVWPALQRSSEIETVQCRFLRRLTGSWALVSQAPDIRVFAFNFRGCSDSGCVWKRGLFHWKPPQPSSVHCPPVCKPPKLSLILCVLCIPSRGVNPWWSQAFFGVPGCINKATFDELSGLWGCVQSRNTARVCVCV